MSENNIEPEALPSTSQSVDVNKSAIIPLVSLPKVVLTRLDLKNLPVPLYKGTSPTKKPVKRLISKKNKAVVSKSLPPKAGTNLKHDTRFRGKPKKDYKILSEFGESSSEIIKSRTSSGRIGGIVKKASKVLNKENDNSVKGMLKKTMLQKRSKIIIPPAKKTTLAPTKTTKSHVVPPKLKKETTNAVASPPKKEILQNIQDTPTKMDIDTSEDEFLYDELIDELVNTQNKKVLSCEKTTNITLKPNIGNKPPTIVKGGIVKKSSLPPDLKSVASPMTLNSYKLTGTALNSKGKSTAVENAIKTPATADTPKASLPVRASPFPIAINLSPSKTGPKDQVKKASVKSVAVVKEDQPINFNLPTSSGTQAKTTPKPKFTAPAPRSRGKPKIGPKKVIKPPPILSTTVDEDSDEYTEVETLENIDSEMTEPQPNDSKNDDVQILTVSHSSGSVDPNADQSKIKSKSDQDPHLDLLRILTDDTEDANSEPGESKELNTENPHSSTGETSQPNLSEVPKLSNDPSSQNSEKPNAPGNLEQENSNKLLAEQASEGNPGNGVIKNDVLVETQVEETPPVRTIYDLMNDVSLKYPSWNLHIIPETNAFCIAQVTKGRLGLPTLKKCIELDAETYRAKVYIHQYHIKRFDGIFDSEEAILDLIEEIHSIKA